MQMKLKPSSGRLLRHLAKKRLGPMLQLVAFLETSQKQHTRVPSIHHHHHVACPVVDVAVPTSLLHACRF